MESAHHLGDWECSEDDRRRWVPECQRSEVSSPRLREALREAEPWFPQQSCGPAKASRFSALWSSDLPGSLSSATSVAGFERPLGLHRTRLDRQNPRKTDLAGTKTKAGRMPTQYVVVFPLDPPQLWRYLQVLPGIKSIGEPDQRGDAPYSKALPAKFSYHAHAHA